SLRPGPMKDEQEPVMEDVEKARQRRVAGVPHPLARVLRQVARQRPVRAPEPEEGLGDVRRPAFAPRNEAAERRRLERGGRSLGHAERLVGRTHGLAEPRRGRERGLEATERDVEVEAPRVARQPLEPAQIVGRRPIFGGHRTISPRCTLRSAVSANELIETYLLKKPSSTRPSKTTLVPSKAASSHSSVTSIPRAKLAGPASGNRRTTGRPTADRMPSICRRVLASDRSP